MDIIFCTHCGYKDDKDNFINNVCPKCGCDILRNLSKDYWCIDCLQLVANRDNKTNIYTNQFHCKLTGNIITYHTPACGDIDLKSNHYKCYNMNKVGDYG